MNREIIVFDATESLLVSWGRDVVSFGCFIGAAWFVNTQIAPSGWLNFVLAVTWFMSLTGRRIGRMTPEQAMKRLRELGYE